jgi:hypothetical protein
LKYNPLREYCYLKHSPFVQENMSYHITASPYGHGNINYIDLLTVNSYSYSDYLRNKIFHADMTLGE